MGLYRDGLILGYKKFTALTKNCVEVFLKHTPSGNFVVFSFTNISKPSREPYIRLRQLKAEIKKFDTGVGIIRTAKFGLTTTKLSFKNKTGGLFLGKIF